MMRSYRRRASRQGHWLDQEEMSYYDNSKSKSISREPTSEESEVEEEEEEEQEEEKEDEEEEEEEEDKKDKTSVF